MWKQIAADLLAKFNTHFTYIQVESRYKTVMKRRKGAIKNNKEIDARQEHFYDMEMKSEMLVNRDDSIEPDTQNNTPADSQMLPSSSPTASI